MQKYVLGFLFNKQGNMVWLIRKNKPEWQAGQLNGIGGKIEENETPGLAMQREFKEEAGLDIIDWKWYGTITDDNYFQVFCFYAYSDEMASTMTDECVGIYSSEFLPMNVIPNLRWLIPMALSLKNDKNAKSFLFSY